MTIEQIQLILKAVQELGVNGKDAFLLYLIFDKGLPILLGVLVLIVTGFLANRLIRLNRFHLYLQELRDGLAIGTGGFVSDSELQSLKKKIRYLINKQGTEK